ncbi:cystatin-A-like [Panulirus ornatus]|uniref:cystatin-A-like n=1 Tax=Panulirus ornatus TaxID=150431 RepID=UPI003A86D541
MMTGGLTAEKPPSDKVEQLLQTVKGQVEEKLGRAIGQFKLVSYKTQVVAGINYFAKMDIGEEELLHVRVYQNLKQNLSLDGIQHPKGREEEIEYF